MDFFKKYDQKYFTLSREVIHKNPWWKYRHDTYQLGDDKADHYYYCQPKDMSIVVSVLPEGRLVMVLPHRYLGNRRSC